MICKKRKCMIAISALLNVMVVAMVLVYSWDISLPYYKLWESRVCACPKCLTDEDPFFWEMIHSSPQLFLSKDHNTSEKDFKWWRRLQPGKGNFKLYNATLDKLFQVIPPFPGVVGPSPKRCRTCAVVGNSGNLNGSQYGSLIDGHDIIIRMNKGSTKGFEADVGSKTTHHVMYPQSAVKLDNTSRLVFYPYKINDLLWLHNKFNPNADNPLAVWRKEKTLTKHHQHEKAKGADMIANRDLVMVLNPAFMRYVHEAWLQKKGRYPSTGFITVALSMHICDKVNVFGFGADKHGNWNHYFEQLKNKRLKTGQHAGSHEYKVIEELHSKEKIHFFTPQ